MGKVDVAELDRHNKSAVATTGDLGSDGAITILTALRRLLAGICFFRD